MNEFKLITVERIEKGDKKELKIKNPTKLKLIGKGSQGAVFQLSEDRCVKIYVKPNAAMKEGNALEAAADLNIVPQVYEVGSNYVIMEYLQGTNLKDYLKKIKKMPKEFTEQIIMIRKELKRVGFTRIKTSIGHFIVTEGDVLKAIDHSDGLTMHDPYNPKMFRDLKKLGLLNTFLEQAKEIDPDSYEDWQENIDFSSI
ncbi:RIO1 family regulatory kinase/ATPase domain-containing protein [Halalkalibacter okhensis]|uniref:RIO1 family regulatory kinase/ATPase domain-containing protein n=1 Tax=Halalkalibacter okhensis TaxID=333138 RepID=UPI00068B323B|nr:RIO1 family regulatory kinase/ATPase [Halalkalibacter okhensis]